MSQVLTDKQRRFVEEYIVDLNATQAAIRAGYSVDSARQIASEMLSKPYIQDALEQHMQERSKRTAITADYVLGTIKDTVERCCKSKPIFNRDGDQVGEEFDASNVLRGSELLGKHLKLFTDRTEHAGNIDSKINGNIGVTLTLTPEESYKRMLDGQ